MIAGKALPWRRYWTPLGGRISVGHDGRGFMDDPEDDFGRSLNPNVFRLTELLGRPCLVLSGQPGIGKTSEVEVIQRGSGEWLEPGEKLIALAGRLIDSQDALRRRTVDSQEWREALASGGKIRLLIDGVDEALRRVSFLVALLIEVLKGQPLVRIKVILVCRAAEWRHADGEALSALWGAEAADVVFELCPLRWKDVELAARESGVDPGAFYQELTWHQVQGLAARPITLRLLLTEMRESGNLPGSHHELFSRATARLCEEVDDERARHLPGQRANPVHLARVAGRIAVLTMLGGRDVIVRSGDDAGPGELPIGEIATGTETVADEKFAVTQDLVIATLDTPLFSFRGSERYGFDHQTFAEHLAAEYLRSCTCEQLRRLLCVSFDGQERVAPQLAEVAARIAVMNPEWCDYLIVSDPALLLRADSSPLSDDQRERAIGSLLARAEREEAFDEAGTGFFYHTLRHPRIADQLRPYIANTAYNPVVRRMAINIAGNAKVFELEPLLWERIEARDPAFGTICGALNDIVGPQSQGRLLAGLRGELPDDDGNDLRDLALRKLVPGVLAVRNVLAYLDPPRRDYTMFAYGLANHLSVEDLPEVLKGMESGHFAGHDFHSLNELGARTVELTLENLHDPKIAASFARYWRASVRGYHAMPARMGRNEHNPLAGLEDDSKRQTLARLVLALPDAQPEDVGAGDSRLIRKIDTNWLFNELPNVPPENRKSWAVLAARAAWQELPPETEDLLKQRYADAPELRAALPKVKRFDIATTLRRLRQAGSLRMERNRARFARQWPQRLTRTELLDRVWRQLDTNDTVWVGFCDVAYLPESTDPQREGHPDRGDITDSPAWFLASEDQRARLKSAARRFLLTRSDKGRATGTWTNWAGGACWAIRLLCDDLETDGELRGAVINRWPRVVFDDHDHNSDVQRATVAAVYRLVPKIAVERLANKLRDDNRSGGFLSDLGRYINCWDARLVNVVKRFLFSRGLTARSIRHAFQFLAEHDRASALSLFDKVLDRRRGFAPLNEHGRALLTVGIFLLSPERWDITWAALQRCSRPLSQRVFHEAAHDLFHRKLNFQETLSTAQLIDLCGFVWRLFPVAEYRDMYDSEGHVTSRHMMPELREGLTSALVTRATPEACDGLRWLATLVPIDERVWMHWRLNEAVKNAMRMAWTARSRTSRDLLVMTREASAITIDTVDDLLEAVRASLERLQKRLAIVESPHLRALWNEPGNGRAPSPKHESALSDMVADWLRHDLGKDSGIVLNREVQATKLNKLDIKVEARSPFGPVAPLTVVIEIKGDWHPEVTTSLGVQLAERYLLANHWTHGIYLIGWFGMATPRSIRGRKPWPPHTIVEARHIAESWQRDQCPPGLVICAVVLDCSSHTGRQ